MNVIFMGTPLFAVPTLKAIYDSKSHKVVAVFSQKPKAKGRGMKITESPIHEIANNYNIPVYTPSILRNEDADKLIKSIEADIIVVVAYGFIIPKNILQAKKYGCLNIHPSDLPKYRGAAPLQRAIINGESKTAVCIMQMDEGLDTGDILAEEKFSISNKITFTELHDKASQVGAQMLIQTLDNIDKIKPFKQSEEGVLYAHKLSKEESKIDWNESAFVIDCKIRGMNPWPGVYFEYQSKKIKIMEAEYINSDHKYDPGSLLDNKTFFEVACGKGILRILKLQPEGKRIMNAQDYLLGFNSKGNIKKL
ncbi:MAG: methionyl-tRNA formyltransferase [Rickettsiaceae bacterium]